MSEWTREWNAKRKVIMATDPSEPMHPLSKRKKGEKSAGKKVLMDRVKQAKKELDQNLMWIEQAKAKQRGTWWLRHTEKMLPYYQKRYDQAAALARAAGCVI